MSVEYIDSAFIKSILRLLENLEARVDSTQRSIAAFREQVEDFRVETQEDNADLKRRLWELQFMRRALAS